MPGQIADPNRSHQLDHIVIMEEEESSFTLTRRNKSIRKVREWQNRELELAESSPAVHQEGPQAHRARPVFRGRTPSYEALRCAVTELYRIDDFESERIGEGFFSEVFRVTHKTTERVMVLKKNKYRSNSLNSLKEIQLMNKLRHPNILRFEAVCVHEGQLHALTEYIEGGTLEELILETNTQISWSQRIQIGLHISSGLHYLHCKKMFHRDLTSKNIFMRTNESSLFAIIGDFGLATRIPEKCDERLPQVGSPYWMSPECLKGKFYDQQSDIFSFGIVMCELIARIEADPDILPRTQNFGVEYKAFCALCPSCPADFLKLTFTCVNIDPDYRPLAQDLLSKLGQLLEEQKFAESQEKTLENKRKFSSSRKTSSSSSGGRQTPSEKARLHHKLSLTSQSVSAQSVGEEMCRLDPHYSPQPEPHNPFTTLPRLREGRKIIGSTSELFSSCVEILSPQDQQFDWLRRKSLPSSARRNRESPRSPGEAESSPPAFSQLQDVITADSQTRQEPRRWGSCESGIFSSSTEDWNSPRSHASSLLTVSDLEEDLRAASALLQNTRASSVLSESLEDISACLDDISSIGAETATSDSDRYEKDIREIVEYFERNCQSNNGLNLSKQQKSSENVRSQKIENLIKKVAENKSRARQNKRVGQQELVHLKACQGIVSSKLHIFDQNSPSRAERPPVRKLGTTQTQHGVGVEQDGEGGIEKLDLS